MGIDGIDIGSLASLGIPDLRVVTENGEVIGVRGQCLACRKNRWHFDAVLGAGVSTIIDLRTGDYRNDLLFLCEKNGIGYYHIPIDKKHTPAHEIISRLPLLIEALSCRNFYISCTQGLHRTDTALALHFMFNPKAVDPPLMYGHVIGGRFKSGEVYGRVGSVFHSLTEEDKAMLGWDEAFEAGFSERKSVLSAAQEQLINPAQI